MPTNKLPEFITRLRAIEEKMTNHLIESTGIKADIVWLKWLNMGVAALVLFKLVADWIR